MTATEERTSVGEALNAILSFQRDTLDFVKTVDSRLVAQQAHWGGRLEERIAKLEKTVLAVLASTTSDETVAVAQRTVRAAGLVPLASPQSVTQGQQTPRKPGRPRLPIGNPEEPESDIRARLAGFTAPVDTHQAALAYLSAGLMVGANKLAHWLATSPDLEPLRIYARHVAQVETLATSDPYMLWLAQPASLPRGIQIARGADVLSLFTPKQLAAYQAATKG